MIKKVSAKNFKGKSFEHALGEKTLITGPNGSGKSSIVQALQLAVDGQVAGGVHKTNQAVMEAFGGNGAKMYVEATLVDNTLLGRQFERDRDSVKQVLMVDRRRTDSKGFTAAAVRAGCPRIVAIDEFLGMSAGRMIKYLSQLIGQNDIEAISSAIEDKKKKINALQAEMREAEVFISRSSQNIADLNLPAGSLAEVQAEIQKLEAELDEARRDLAGARAAEEAALRERQERDAGQKNGKEPVDISTGQTLPEGSLSEPKNYGLQIHCVTPADSFKAIIAEIEQGRCPTCRGGIALLVAKRELKKWEGRRL